MPVINTPAAPLRLMVVLVACTVPGTTMGWAPPPGNLLRHGDCEEASDDGSQPAAWQVRGDATWTRVGLADEFAGRGFSLHAGADINGDGLHEAKVSQEITDFPRGRGQWFRCSLRGMPQDQFAVARDDLQLKVEFFGDGGRNYLESVTKRLYPLIERERRDLAANGNGGKGGAAAWKSYSLEFMLPFAEIDVLRISIGFRSGASESTQDAFWIDELELIPLGSRRAAAPEITPAPANVVRPAIERNSLRSLGGHWHWQAETDLAAAADRIFTWRDADRLWYDDGGRWTNPFAENMSAWLRAGYKDRAGNVAAEDRWLPDNIQVRFEREALVLRVKNLPNHPTARFPDLIGVHGYNPAYIQEQDDEYFLPLSPERNPQAVAMNAGNANRALPRGPIGVAVNGVVFFNPFDADDRDATDLMDRCCGHPSPDNRYHYHKYPVCVKSPFADEGLEHSPIVGWAFDGFAIYGPYERAGVMAKDCDDNPLNEFNIHRDELRGWHYHVTPGKFPYVIGGWWGEVDPRNLRRPRGFPPRRPKADEDQGEP